jgi:hypothetical protein
VLGDDEAADGRTHRYTAPDADVGWDSHEGVFYLGYTLYNISWHSREHGIDLPLFVAQRAASQHDALTAMSATAHMLDVDPSLRPAHFCHDSAADAAHLYQYMRHVGVVPVIDWNASSGLFPLLKEHEQYFKGDTDLLHPNDPGHERMARTLMYQLLALPCTF